MGGVAEDGPGADKGVGESDLGHWDDIGGGNLALRPWGVELICMRDGVKNGNEDRQNYGWVLSR